MDQTGPRVCTRFRRFCWRVPQSLPIVFQKGKDMPKITKLPPALTGLSGLALAGKTAVPKPAKGPKGKGPGQIAGVKKTPLPGKSWGR